MRVPAWLGRLLAGEVPVRLMTEARGASDAKAKHDLGWQPAWSSWREGFRHGLTDPASAPHARSRVAAPGSDPRKATAPLRRGRRAAASEAFQSLHPLMFSSAYGMPSSASESEDVALEAFPALPRALAEGAEITSPKAYLSAVGTPLAIDQLRSARARRESSIGAWLPEPLLTDSDPPRAESCAVSVEDPWTAER